MPDFPVSFNTWKTLEARMLSLGIRESDLEESFVRSGGPGGQNVNKVSTRVLLLHRPTGVQVHCQEDRSQAMNRFLARRRLADKIEEMRLGAASRKQQAIEKIRRQKRKRGKRAKEKMLRDKHHRADVKRSRGAVRDGGD